MKLTFHTFIFFTLILTLAAVSTLQAADEEARQIGLLFEGTFEKADIVSQVEGAAKTQLAAAHTWKYGVKLFSDQSWKDSGLQWETFAARAAATADEIAKGLKPEYVRNFRGVIDYAIVRGEHPFFSSAITSPKFVEPFLETLGDKLHVIVLDRHVLYVFPATGGSIGDYGMALLGIFKQTRMPVSLEVFEVTAHNFRVVGEIERTGRQTVVPPAPPKPAEKRK